MQKILFYKPVLMLDGEKPKYYGPLTRFHTSVKPLLIPDIPSIPALWEYKQVQFRSPAPQIKNSSLFSKSYNEFPQEQKN